MKKKVLQFIKLANKIRYQICSLVPPHGNGKNMQERVEGTKFYMRERIEERVRAREKEKVKPSKVK